VKGGRRALGGGADVRPLDALGDQLAALLVEPRLGARLEREVIERSRHAEPAGDPGIVAGRHAGHAAGLHERDELVTSSVEEDVADLAALFGLDYVSAGR